MAKFNILQCNNACIDCVKNYKSKHDLKSGGEFKINCCGIPKQYVSEQMSAQIPAEDVKSMISMLDPVTWAAEVLDWHCLDPDGAIWKRKTEENSLGEVAPYKEEYAELVKQGKSAFNRTYQAAMLRCTSKRKVFRLGRQNGKCLPDNTLIQMWDGTRKPVQSIQVGEKVVAINNNNESVAAEAYLLPNGVVDVALLELMDGRTIEASLNHPFLTRTSQGRSGKDKKMVYLDEWKDLEDIKIGDYVAVPINIGELGIEDYDWKKISLLGLLLADGNVKGGNFRFLNLNKEILSEITTCLDVFNCQLKQYESDSDCDYHIVYKDDQEWGGQFSREKGPLSEWLYEIGVYGQGAHEKQIPDFVFKLKNERIANLLSSMYGCDGWASNNGRPEIGYSTVSKTLAEQVVALLARFNIYTTMAKKKTTCNGKKFESYQLIISRKESIYNFFHQIGILGKNEALQNVYTASLTKDESPKTDAYTDNDITFIKVRSVTRTGQKQTWDLTVPEHHTFIANNIVTHNTESMVIAMLHAIFTHQNFRVIVITPYQTQIELIFGRLMQLINSKPTTANSVKRIVRAPNFTLELHNGSRISGFTAGTKSGGNADAVRGQKANMLVFDEADYLSPGDMASALAVITNYPDATVWMSSTPTGAHEKFYESCFSPVYKEFYYPSMANPLWSKELEEFYRGQLTDIEYDHEVLANFGEQEQGVYQGAYVEDAMMDYQYEDQARKPNWVYCMGVDWNDQKIGTTICVVGHNPSTGIFQIVNRAVVSRENWTQHAACQRIVEMNRYWQPAWIYIDRGFGSTQSEILRKYGFDSLARLRTIDKTEEANIAKIDGRLSRIVEEYDFGSKITIKDLFTKEDRDKSAKPFLVENSVRRFENRQIKFSKDDTQLEAELRGYIVDHVTVSGIPVYKQGNEKVGDHNLDALNLALVAFTLKLSSFGNPSYDNGVAFTGNFGENVSYGNNSVTQTPLVTKVTDLFKPNSNRQQSTKPSMDRAFPVEQPKLIGGSQIPAFHTNESSVALWSWPGFSRDEPRPTSRTSTFSRRPAPPCRKKF